MRYLALEREIPGLPRPDRAALLRLQAASLWHLQSTGVIRDLTLTHPERRTVMVLECTSLAAARGHVADLPLVRAGLVEFQLHELRPYDGYEQFFAAGFDSPDGPAQAPAEY